MKEAKKAQKKVSDEGKLQDAARLLAIYNARADQYHFSPQDFATRNGFSSASLVYQYSNGKIPLNIKAAAQFARGLSCAIGDFSPTIAAELAAVGLMESCGPGSFAGETLAMDERRIVEWYRTAPEDLRRLLQHLASKTPVKTAPAVAVEQPFLKTLRRVEPANDKQELHSFNHADADVGAAKADAKESAHARSKRKPSTRR